MTDVPDADAQVPPAVPAEEAPVDVVDHIIGVSFEKATRADEVLLSLIHLQQEGEIALTDAVVVWKDEDERVHVRQTVDPTPGRSALTGSIWGMLVGMLFGGPVFLATAAAGAGGAALMAKLVDLGLDDRWVKEVGKWLDPGTSALLILVSDGVRPVVVKELSRFEGQVLYCTFPEAVRRELERALATTRPVDAD